MQKKPINILSFKSPFFPSSNHSHHSKKTNNKFKKSSTSNYSTKTKPNNPQSQVPLNNPIGINSINNNIYLNLFNKYNSNTSSLKQNMISPKEIISNRINNSQMNKIRKNLNLYEMPCYSIHNKNKSTYIQPNLIDSMNFINNHGHINIRLNLKNQIINGINNNNISDYNINTGLEIAEKMKEKNNKIIQLQKDLLKSQEIIHDLNNKNNSFKCKEHNKNKNVANLNKSSREKNIFMTTKSSESVDKILKTAFNEYNLDNIINKKSNKKNHKNSFLKKSGNINNIKRENINNKKQNKNKNLKISDILYTNNNSKNKKQNDYLRLFLPTSNFYKTKSKYNSYSNDRKNAKNKINHNLDYNSIKTDNNKRQQINKKNSGNNNITINEFIKKCEYIKQKARNLINNYIDLVGQLEKSKKDIIKLD